MLNPFDPTPIKVPAVPEPAAEDLSTEAAASVPGESEVAGVDPTEARPDSVDRAPAPDDDDEVFEADAVLITATGQARAALELMTPADTVGEYLGYIVEGEHLASLLFDCLLAGYPGWRWTVSLSRLDGDAEPQVLETELMPGDDALLAPEWVPWSDRLADSRVAEELAAAALEGDEDDDDDDEDEDSADVDDAADDGVDLLDGIDFDEALTASELHDGEPGETEAEAEDGAPQPPAQARGMQFSAEDE